MNSLDIATNQTCKFEISNNARGTWNTFSQIRLKTTIFKSTLYDYSDAYILVEGTTTAAANTTLAADINNK